MANEDLDWYTRLKQNPELGCFVVICPKCLLNVPIIGQPEDTNNFCTCDDTEPISLEEIVRAHGLELFISIFTPANLSNAINFNNIAERA